VSGISEAHRRRNRRYHEHMVQDDEKRRAARKMSDRWRKSVNDALPKPRGGYQWTGPEFEIAVRDDLTARQAAIMIGRSVWAVRKMRGRIRNEPKLQRVLGAQT